MLLGAQILLPLSLQPNPCQHAGCRSHHCRLRLPWPHQPRGSRARPRPCILTPRLLEAQKRGSRRKSRPLRPKSSAPASRGVELCSAPEKRASRPPSEAITRRSGHRTERLALTFCPLSQAPARPAALDVDGIKNAIAPSEIGASSQAIYSWGGLALGACQRPQSHSVLPARTRKCS